MQMYCSDQASHRIGQHGPASSIAPALGSSHSTQWKQKPGLVTKHGQDRSKRQSFGSWHVAVSQILPLCCDGTHLPTTCQVSLRHLRLSCCLLNACTQTLLLLIQSGLNSGSALLQTAKCIGVRPSASSAGTALLCKTHHSYLLLCVSLTAPVKKNHCRLSNFLSWHQSIGSSGFCIGSCAHLNALAQESPKACATALAVFELTPTLTWASKLSGRACCINNWLSVPCWRTFELSVPQVLPFCTGTRANVTHSDMCQASEPYSIQKPRLCSG